MKFSCPTPTQRTPSRVELLDNTGRVLFQSQIQEKNLTADQNNPDIVMPYNSHSPGGDVTVSTTHCVIDGTH